MGNMYILYENLVSLDISKTKVCKYELCFVGKSCKERLLSLVRRLVRLNS